jgi:hypothetical protein
MSHQYPIQARFFISSSHMPSTGLKKHQGSPEDSGPLLCSVICAEALPSPLQPWAARHGTHLLSLHPWLSLLKKKQEHWCQGRGTGMPRRGLRT